MTGPELCQALWVASQADGCATATRQQLFQEAVPAAYSSLGDLSPADLVRLLSSYTAAGCYSQELFAAATEFIWEQLPTLTPGQLADVAVAYAAAGHYDNDEDMWQAIADRAAARAQEFEPHQLAALLESAAFLRFRHAPLCSAALAAAAAGATRWQTRPLAQVVFALGWLGHGVGPGEGPQLDRIAATIATRLRNLMTSTDVTRVVAQGVRRVPGGACADRLSPLVGAAAAAAGGGGGGGGGGGFLGTSSEAAALTARTYSWQQPSQQQAQQQQQQQQQQRPPSQTQAQPKGPGAHELPRPHAHQQQYDSSSDDEQGAAGADVRPAVESPSELRDSLCRLVWGYLALGRLPNALLRESFKLLGSFPPSDYTQPQLALLFEAGMRAQEMGHNPVDTHPLMATSVRVFVAEAKRAPRNLSLSPDLQPFAFSAWLRGTRGGRAPLAAPPLLAASGGASARRWRAAAPCGRRHHRRGHPPRPEEGEREEEPSWPLPESSRFSSWRYRDAAATTPEGLEGAVSEALVACGAAPSPPALCLTLDGVMQVPLPLARGNARVAVEPLAPAAAARNPPHAPLGAAAVRHEMLRYRGWGVAQVLFSEWHDAGEAGRDAAGALLTGVVDAAEGDLLCVAR